MDSPIGAPDSQLPSPSFCVSRSRLDANAQRTRSIATQAGVMLRVHVKTHKAVPLLSTQFNAGEPRSIVVSTLAEAEAFAPSVADLLYGVLIEPSKLPRLASLATAHPGVQFSVLVDSRDAVAMLLHEWPVSAPALGLFIKVDTGYHRAGVDAASESNLVAALATVIVTAAPRLLFRGLYSHSGHSYCACPEGEIGAENKAAKARAAAGAVLESEIQAMTALALQLLRFGLSAPVLSIGATPSTSCGAVAVKALQAGTAALERGHCTATALEIHPGNDIFYDRQQVASGACSISDVACYVISRVIGVYPARNEILIDAGGCAMHKDPAGMVDRTWGELVDSPGVVLLRMTQEAAVCGR